MIGREIINNGVHRDVYFSDEEVWALSMIDAGDEPGLLRGSMSIAEKEMACQRDMRVRGRRLWNYHQRVGDLLDYIDIPALPAIHQMAVVQ